MKEMVVIRSPSPQLVPFKLHRFGQQRLAMLEKLRRHYPGRDRTLLMKFEQADRL
ncbi:hypothetical protein ACK3Z1_20180 [Aeromonas caviae]